MADEFKWAFPDVFVAQDAVSLLASGMKRRAAGGASGGPEGASGGPKGASAGGAKPADAPKSEPYRF